MKRLHALAERIVSEETTLHGLRATKAALMSILLTGEVRITPDRTTA